jgi:transcriptional regulator
MAGKPLEILKGTLDVLLLKTLSRGPMHGYGVSRWIRETTDEAFQVEEGALYPALRRLEKRGLVEAYWSTTSTGREARFYRLTGEGKEALEKGLATWHRYVRAMGRVLEGEAAS